MPLIIGTTNIGDIYKGTTKIDSVYKGTALVYTSGTWEQYFYEYIYYSLVPTTINSKQVKNRARVNTIYGNSVVENQLLGARNETITRNGLTYEYSSNGSIKITNTATSYTYLYLGSLENNYIKYYANHKYLCNFIISGTVQGIAYNVLDESSTQQKIITKTNDGTGRVYISFSSGSSVNCTITPILIDLTQMFPINTPTTLTDTRVQALLNRGYIAYNTGTLKSVDVGAISSEPYNLFDEVLESGSIRLDNGQNNNSVVNATRSKNYISVLPSTSYTLEYPVNTALIIYEYDEDHNYIEGHSTSSTMSVSRTLTNRTRYVRFAIGNNDLTAKVCFHITGTRTGYAPHTNPQSIAFKYQGSGVGTAHDTLEITSSAYVFTKNMAAVDLGSLDYNYSSATNSFWSTTLDTLIATTDSNSVCNMLCQKYPTISAYNLLNGQINSIAFSMTAVVVSGNSYTPHFRVRDTAYTDPTTFKTAMSGVSLEYPLATPQVISIPKKHLGIVDLGSLNWVKRNEGTANSRFNVSNAINNPNTSNNLIANIYCCEFISGTINETYSHTRDNLIATASGLIQVYSSKYDNLTAEQFKTAMSGIYLFYETTDEVADIPISLGVESGGTLTTDSDVLPNILMEVKCK